MNYDEYYCKLHLKPITNICMEEHNCSDRRLCTNCLYESHKQSTKEKTPTFEMFQNKIKEELKCLEKKYNDSSKQFLIAIANLKKCLIKIISQLNDFALIVKEQGLENSLAELQDLFQNVNLIGYVNNGDFSFLKHLYNPQIIGCYFNILERFANMFKRMTDIWDKFKLCHLERVNTDSKVAEIEGIQCFKSKIGDFHYIQDTGSKEFAGKYFFNRKCGLWKEGEKEPIKYSFCKYFLGFKIHQLPLQFHEKDQKGRKQGNYLESPSNGNNQFQEFGSYKDGLRVGAWMIYYQGESGGENYNEQGEKIMEWSEGEVNKESINQRQKILGKAEMNILTNIFAQSKNSDKRIDQYSNLGSSFMSKEDEIIIVQAE